MNEMDSWQWFGAGSILVIFGMLLKVNVEITAVKTKLTEHCKTSAMRCPLHDPLEAKVDTANSDMKRHHEDSSRHFTGNKATLP